MELFFRNALPDDLKLIVEIYNSTIPLLSVTADTELVNIESRLEWFNEHTTKARPLWIVEIEKEIIGWVSFQNFYGRPAYNMTAELSIYLHELQRGKGYGKKILTHCMNVSHLHQIKNLVGFIFSHNTRSIKLFEEMGFECWGTLPDIAVLGGIERSLKIFGKRIN